MPSNRLPSASRFRSNLHRPQPAPAVRTFDRAIADLTIARMVELGQEIVETLLAADPDVRASVELKRGVQRRRIRNQAGAEIAVERSPFSIGVELMRVKGDDVLVMADSFGATLWPDDPLAFVGALRDKLAQAQTPGDRRDRAHAGGVYAGGRAGAGHPVNGRAERQERLHRRLAADRQGRREAVRRPVHAGRRRDARWPVRQRILRRRGRGAPAHRAHPGGRAARAFCTT